MVPVEPNVTLRRLAQILGIRAVVHDAVMLVVSAWVGGGPPDNGRVVVGRFELRRFGDLDVLGPLLRRRDLSDDWGGEEQGASRDGDRQFHEQSIHRTGPQLLSLGNVDGRNMAPIDVPVLWDRHRGQRRDAANIRRAGELRETPSRGEGLITLGRCRNTGRGGHALTSKGIDVLIGADRRVGRVETIGQCLQERYDLVLLLIRQAEHTGGTLLHGSVLGGEDWTVYQGPRS